MIGIIDSGVSPSQFSRVRCGQGFFLDEINGIYRTPDFLDQFNHGSQTTACILHHLPHADLCVAKVFSQGLATSTAQITSALEWMIEQEVKLVNMSLGLMADRKSIRDACEAASRRGIVLVSSSPAHGEAVYPASYSSVISVTGDARCNLDQCSYLNSPQAEFGASVRSPSRGLAGSSIAAAHFSGMIAATAQRLGLSYSDAVNYLRQSAPIQGEDKTPWLGPNAEILESR